MSSADGGERRSRLRSHVLARLREYDAASVRNRNGVPFPLTMNTFVHDALASEGRYAPLETVETLHDLLREGIVSPGRGDSLHAAATGQMRPADVADSYSLPHLFVTSYGRRYLEDTGHDPDPYDAVALIEALRKRVAAAWPAPDDVVERYLGEAVAAFRAGAYLGTNILAGVAAEAVAERLYDAMEKHLDAAGPAFRTSLDQKRTSAEGRWKTFVGALGRHRATCLDEPVDRAARERLEPLLLLLKANRDDGAHRRTTPITRDEARAALTSFAAFAGIAGDIDLGLRAACRGT